MECVICQEEKVKVKFYKLNSCSHQVCKDCKNSMLSSPLCYTLILGEKCIKCPVCREVENMPYDVLLKKAKYMERDYVKLLDLLVCVELQYSKEIEQKNKRIKNVEKENRELLKLIKVNGSSSEVKRKKSGECNCGCISKKTKKVTITRRRCSGVSCENYCCRACEVCLVHK